MSKTSPRSSGDNVQSIADYQAAHRKVLARREGEMRAVLEEIFQKIWIDENDAMFDELYHPNCVIEGIVPGADVGLKDFRDAVRELRFAQQYLDYEIIDFLSDGDTRCAVRIRYKVYLPAPDKTADLYVQCFYTIVEKRVTHVCIVMDRLDLLERIDALPEGAYFIGISGGQMS